MISHYTPVHLILFLVGVVICLIVDLRAHGKDGDAALFPAGYGLEKALSVDNLFVPVAGKGKKR